ncbi:hypothetical protein [Rubrolithibacter danxiaensis]|uniref:hypothetical protein n=1 Tax=Rubrolithibacter danxiaensis TaxID=3390805 RepID=UPI003BF91167
MGLPFRITYKDKDYVYEIINESPITKNTTQLHILLNGEKFSMIKNEQKVWVQQEGDRTLDPEFIQAIGRSVSLRFRM